MPGGNPEGRVYLLTDARPHLTAGHWIEAQSKRRPGKAQNMINSQLPLSYNLQPPPPPHYSTVKMSPQLVDNSDSATEVTSAPSTRFPHLPAEIISRIVELIPKVPHSADGTPSNLGEENYPDYATLRVCLQVSSSFYGPAHKAIFDEVSLEGRQSDPDYILRRIKLLADLMVLSDSRNEREPGCVLRSVTRDIRVFTMLPNTVHPFARIREQLITIIKHLARENRGRSGGKLEYLNMTGDVEMNKFVLEDMGVPDYVLERGAFWKSALELAASKSIRDLVLNRFFNIPMSTFSGCTFDTMDLIDCTFSSDLEESDVTGLGEVVLRGERAAGASISALGWDSRLGQPFGICEQRALINPALSEARIVVDLSYNAVAEHPGWDMLSQFFTSDIDNLKDVHFYLSCEYLYWLFDLLY